MITKAPPTPGADELDELNIARTAHKAASQVRKEASIFEDACMHVLRERFRKYCGVILPYFIRNGASFWLVGNYAGEYKLPPHRDWTYDGEWLTVRVIRYTKKGKVAASSKWEELRFNPDFIAKNALNSKPGAGAPP